MRINISPTRDFLMLVQETLSRRKLPVNFNSVDLKLFSHELEKAIPATTLLELHNVKISAKGILFKGNHILPESFAFPSNIRQWKLRSFLKFFATNNFLRRARTIEQEVLWVTDDWSNGYFHWLTDVLSRLFVMRDRLDEKVLLLPWNFQSLDFVQASLKLFDVKVEFIGKNEVVKCRRVWMPTHTAPSGHYNEPVIRGVRDLLRETYGTATQENDNERIYISRSRAPKRRIANEPAITDILIEFGFRTIFAEDLSFAQQARIFSGARYLVSNHGAGLTNMLFMTAGASVLELRHETDAVNNCYFTLASALGLNYFYQTCASHNADEDPHTAPLVVDAAVLRASLALLVGS
jgi:capsular polysaccharide biosynthesis protein